VTVEGRTEGKGRVRLTVDTGCRPVGAGYSAPVAEDPGPEAAVLADALRALGRPAGTASEPVVAPCPAGAGTARTLRSTEGPTPEPANALASLAAGAPLLDTPEVYAYRRDGVTVVLDRTSPTAVLAATT
ncbi:hypothetical protein C1I99_32020, partial [Micromonospora deserti]